MLGLLSKIKIVDNSGAVLGRCIKILKPNKKDKARVGDIILISIIKSLSRSKYSVGTMAKVLIIRTKSMSFSDNAGIIMNDKNLPVGSRVKGPVPIKLNKNIKLLSLVSPKTII
jgi:large subunit ribosomal protein L14